jgi:formylglycine-generating enzyme required for sulfatase activity
MKSRFCHGIIPAIILALTIPVALSLEYMAKPAVSAALMFTVSVATGVESMVGDANAGESADTPEHTVAVAGSSPVVETKTYAGIPFVTLPGGTFQMGDIQNYDQYSREKPVHDVSITGFEMSMYEVTQAQYQSVTGSNTSSFIGENNPIENVSWHDAMIFTNKMSEMAGLERCYNERTWACDYEANGFRLPTEAEWEYACRAGTQTKYNTGNDLSGDGRTSIDLDSAGWYWINWGDANRTTHAAGEKIPNAWGLYDMHGNVWEWCNDWYDKDYFGSSPPSDPTGPTSGSYRVIRGGGMDNVARDCRSATRDRRDPSKEYMYLGIRVVRRP